MERYKYMTDTDVEGKYRKCDSCNYPAPLAEFTMSTAGPKRGERAMLCEICAGTQIGLAYEYPHQYENQAETLRVVGFVANMILHEIRKLEGIL